MMIPPKLRHNDNLGNLFEKFNAVIDYLREIRLIAGNGIRLNRLPAGTTIESTATAEGGFSSGAGGHPFDAKIINKGTEENPQYFVRIYNSALPDSPYAGIVDVYEWVMAVPVTELEITTQGGFFVVLDVTYDSSDRPDQSVSPYIINLSLIPYETTSNVGYTTYREYIADGNFSNVASHMTGDIYVYGRWA